MAADGRSCIEALITSEDTVKLAKGTDGSVIGCAGDRGACTLVREWFEKGADLARIPDIPRSADGDTPFDALVLRPDGTVQALDSYFSFMPRPAPAAIGSGGQIALGAMLAGKNPKQAVKIAASRVTSVGGTIHELKPKAP
jgi:hypothetical protein